MQAIISQALIKDLKGRDVTVFDARQPGLVLRLRASGVHTYRVQLGRGKFLTLGKAKDLTPDQARRLASNNRGQVAAGKDPIAERRKAKAATLRQFLDGEYQAWALANQKHAGEWIARIKQAFPDLLTKGLPSITAWQIERWRAARHKDGVSHATTNRDLDCLRTVLSRAVEWNLVGAHPLRPVKRAKVDTIGRLRFLSPDEEKSLRTTLVAREESNRKARASFNQWRQDRGYQTIPDYPGRYTDHLQPIVLLALNTGLRRGELLGLRWGDVDLVSARLTVRGARAKTGMTRHIPLNEEAIDVLKAWQPSDVAAGDLVFPGRDAKPIADIKTAWLHLLKDAKLKAFTFHDLRHTFASNLVQAGVDLNTVRELLGHADIKMTLRYAHLAPEHRAAAVAKLNGTR